MRVGVPSSFWGAGLFIVGELAGSAILVMVAFGDSTRVADGAMVVIIMGNGVKVSDGCVGLVLIEVGVVVRCNVMVVEGRGEGFFLLQAIKEKQKVPMSRNGIDRLSLCMGIIPPLVRRLR